MAVDYLSVLNVGSLNVTQIVDALIDAERVLPAKISLTSKSTNAMCLFRHLARSKQK